jgi:hypothetical protein
MNRTMCPGQDTRYWRPDDIFTVACGSCGAGIEFFKDDAARRCPGCGTRVRNPRLSMGCAQWCRHAKECLGYDPREAADGRGDGAARSVADSIVDAMKLEFGAESVIVARSVAAYETARGLIGGSGADPAAVFPAVLLLFADEAGDGLHVACRIMEEAGMERSARDAAGEVIRAYRAGSPDETPELRLVRDSYAG